MHRMIICTVGTSLLTNRDGGRPWAGWRRDILLPEKADVVNWLSEADPIVASAEMNANSRLEVDEGDRIALLHSDTTDGRFCADCIKAHYESKGIRCSLKEIGSLGLGANKFTNGLKALVHKAITLKKEAESSYLKPVFNATGGFKAEIAFLNLLGALLGVEVVYIFEAHSELVTLPKLPLDWDTNFVLENKAFFDWIDSEPRKESEVRSWLMSKPELEALVEKDNDGNMYLTAAGDLLYQAALNKTDAHPHVKWPEHDIKSPHEKDHVSKVAHHRPDGWKKLVEGLTDIPCVSCVRYDASAKSVRSIGILDEAQGTIGIAWGPADCPLYLRVETTAKGKPQTELVMNTIKARLL